MRPLSIAHALFTWQDGRVALEASLRSTAGVVDHVLIADGLIDGVPDSGLPWLSDLSWLQDADYLPASVPVNGKQWRTLSDACTWLLQKANMLGADWLLFIDADQELHNGDRLRAWLERWEGDAFPILRQDPGNRHGCPWQCIRVSAFTRYVAGCYVIETTAGDVVSLVPDGLPPTMDFKQAPWISHHPERRPQWRVKHRLGALETILEPPPPAPALQIPPLMLQSAAMDETTTTAGPPPFYCPACGTRYFGPGVCENQHEPTELDRDPDVPLPLNSPPPLDPESATTPEPAPASEPAATDPPTPEASEPAPAETSPEPSEPVVEEPPATEPAPVVEEPAPTPVVEETPDKPGLFGRIRGHGSEEPPAVAAPVEQVAATEEPAPHVVAQPLPDFSLALAKIDDLRAAIAGHFDELERAIRDALSPE